MKGGAPHPASPVQWPACWTRATRSRCFRSASAHGSRILPAFHIPTLPLCRSRASSTSSSSASTTSTPSAATCTATSSAGAGGGEGLAAGVETGWSSALASPCARSNLLLTDDHRLKIADFGLSRLIPSSDVEMT